MDLTGVLGVFTGIAVATYLILAFRCFLLEKRKLHDVLLGLLFLVIAIRISKSIWFFIFYEVAPFGLMLGLVGLSLIGPLLWLYIKLSVGMEKVKSDFTHFIIPMISILLPFFLSLEWVTILYKTSTLIFLIYLIASARTIYSPQNKSNIQTTSWNRKVLMGISVVWFSFAFQHLTGTLLLYAIGAIISSVPAYYLLIQFIHKPKFSKKMRLNSPSDMVLEKVQSAFTAQKIFLKPSLTLSEFSSELEIPSYLVSKSISELYQKSFPETINHFRINEVKNRLLKNDNEFFKIENLGYDVGFKSPSAFYTAFKKETGMSPNEYRQVHSTQEPVF